MFFQPYSHFLLTLELPRAGAGGTGNSGWDFPAPRIPCWDPSAAFRGLNEEGGARILPEMGAGFIPLEFRHCRTDVSHPSSCSGCSRSDGNMGRWDHGKMGSWEGPGMGGSGQDLTAIPKFRSSSSGLAPRFLYPHFTRKIPGRIIGAEGQRDLSPFPKEIPLGWLLLLLLKTWDLAPAWSGIPNPHFEAFGIPPKEFLPFSSLGIPSGNIQPLRRCSKPHPELIFLPWMSRN